MKDAFGVERVSKGLPSALRGPSAEAITHFKVKGHGASWARNKVRNHKEGKRWGDPNKKMTIYPQGEPKKRIFVKDNNSWKSWRRGAKAGITRAKTYVNEGGSPLKATKGRVLP